MICAICKKNFGDCSCPGVDQRLRELAFDANSPIATKWCRACDKYYAKCQCAKPDFFHVLGGREIDPKTFRTLSDV